MANYDHFLTISHLTKTFEQQDRKEPITVIDDVSMTIEEGEFVVFLGPSGCGKTTLMRIVGGLETATSGSVVLEGDDVTEPDRKKGMVFQSYSSFPWLTVLDNMKFGMKYRSDISDEDKNETARHYLDLVGLKGFEDFYINRISGGMQQRVAIARTFAAGPDILLIDAAPSTRRIANSCRHSCLIFAVLKKNSYFCHPRCRRGRISSRPDFCFLGASVDDHRGGNRR